MSTRSKTARAKLAVLTAILVELFAAPTSAQQTATFSLGLGYDDLGRLETITHPASGAPATTQTYTYNALSGHKTVAYGGQPIVSATTYTPGGGEDEVTLAPYDYRGNRLGAITIDRDWDSLDHLRSLRISLNGTNLHRAHGMSYNEWGYLESVTRSDPSFTGPMTFAYTPLGQLETLTLNGSAVSYTYDANGNLKSRGRLQAQSFDLPELRAINYDTHTNRNPNQGYDQDGKLERADYTYRYNDLEQIVAISEPSSGWDLAQYRYDGNGERVREVSEDRVVYSIRGPDGRLISQEIRRSTVGGGWLRERRDFIYHNGQSIAVISHSDVPTGGVATRRQYTMRDRLGSTAVILDDRRVDRRTNTFVPGYFEFEPYGNQARWPEHYETVNSDWPSLNPIPWGDVVLQFTGHEWDPSGLHYMHQRYYNDWHGQFLRPDPAFDFDETNPASFNLYAYTRGNPVNFIDLDGASSDSSWWKAKLSAALKFLGLKAKTEVYPCPGCETGVDASYGLLTAGVGAKEYGGVPYAKLEFGPKGKLGSIVGGKLALGAQLSPDVDSERHSFAKVSTYAKASANLGKNALIEGSVKTELTEHSVKFGSGSSEAISQLRADLYSITGVKHETQAEMVWTSQHFRNWFSGFYKGTWWYNYLTKSFGQQE